MNDPTSCKLEVVLGLRVGEVFTFSSDLVRVGRSAENDLVVNDSAVSRKHAEIIRDPATSRWRIRDLGSQNGVLVNGTRASEQDLSDGDQLGIGEHKFRFGCSAALAASTDPERTIAPSAAGASVPPKEHPVKEAKHAPAGAAQGRSLLKNRLVLIAGGVVLLFLVLGAVLKLSSGKPAAPKIPPQSREPVPLPAKDAYGFLPFKGMDKSHADKADFTFVARSKKVEATYSTGGVDRPGEVVIYLNGFKIGEADIKMDWTFPRTLVLPPEYIVLNGTNTLTFDSTSNPPGLDPWGVRQVSVADLGGEPCDIAKGMEAFNLGKSKEETKLVAPDNLVRAYDALRRAMLHWEQCAPRPPEYEKATELASAVGQEVAEKTKKMLLDVEGAVRVEQYQSALRTLTELRKTFYDPADPRLAYINEKGEGTAMEMEAAGKRKGKKK